VTASALFVSGQTAAPQQQSAAAPAPSVSPERALLNQYCVSCHNQRMKTADLMLDAIDVGRVGENRATWEKVVRKLRVGMMPPAGSPRPPPATYRTLIAWLENELDRNAEVHMPPPGLHRLNRTEYANVVRDLLDLEVDPAKYLPSDDSTHGFDNIAGALGISSTLVEAYVSAASKISRLALGFPEPPTLTVYRTPEDTSQDYHVEGLPFGTRGGVLVKHVFPSDGESTITVTPIFGDNMSPAGFGSVPCEQLEIILDGERLQLMDWHGGGRAPAAICGGRRQGPGRSGQAGPEAFFGGRGGTPMRVRFKTTAGLHTVGATFLQTNMAPVLDLDQHFARSTVQTGPTPGYTFFPHVGTVRLEGPYDATPAKDSPSRRKIFVCRPSGAASEAACARKIIANVAMRAFRRPTAPPEIDMLMDGIPNIYGSQFRRVTLGPEMDARRGLLGKGAFLTTTSKPERTSPVTRGKWIMTNILGMSPPDPPADVPPLRPRTTDATGNAREQTMRQKMLEHRVRADCVQCHRLMDPIGFALENFDGIAMWRGQDEGTPIDASGEVFDNTRIEGPVGLRKWLTGYSDQFVSVVVEKLVTYALGRGVEYQDMPLVRSIAREAADSDNRFSALLLGVVKSQPFQMNMKVTDAVPAKRLR
jgi:hypothetical protein